MINFFFFFSEELDKLQALNLQLAEISSNMPSKAEIKDLIYRNSR